MPYDGHAPTQPVATPGGAHEIDVADMEKITLNGNRHVPLVIDEASGNLLAFALPLKEAGADGVAAGNNNPRHPSGYKRRRRYGFHRKKALSFTFATRCGSHRHPRPRGQPTGARSSRTRGGHAASNLLVRNV